MTPERLAEIERLAIAGGALSAWTGATILEIIAHIRDLEAPPTYARGCDRDGVGSPCIHELSPDELTGVASHIRDLEAQAINADMGDEILGEIAGTLKELGCDCGPDAHLSTPPMFYREWMLCVMGSAIRSATRDLEAQLAAAREALALAYLELGDGGHPGFREANRAAMTVYERYFDHHDPTGKTIHELRAALATTTPPSPEVGA